MKEKLWPSKKVRLHPAAKMNEIQPDMTQQLITEVGDEIQRLIAMKRLLKSERFRTLYNGSNYDSREDVECMVYKGDLSELQQWMIHHPNLTLEDLTLRRLHDHAREKQIKNYARYSKLELIKKLRDN